MANVQRAPGRGKEKDRKEKARGRTPQHHDRREEKQEPQGKTPEKKRESGTRDELLKTIDDLKKRVEGEVSATIGESPFTKRLEEEKKQRHLKHPNLDAYNGEGDPEDHLNQFDQLSKFYEYTDLTSCRFFATSLKGNAQRWFNRIPARTIDTWMDFKKAFLSKFGTNKHLEVHTIHLESIRQGDREDLEGYLKRFKQAVDKVETVNETEALIHLRRGLNPYECEKYICELMNQKPETLSKAYTLASRFIREAETMKVLKQTRAPQTTSQHHFQSERLSYQRTQDTAPRYTEVVTTRSSGGDSDKNTVPVVDKTRLAMPPPPPPDKRERRPEPNFTVFSMPRESILKEIRGKPFFVEPPPMWTSAGDRDNTKHCDYHGTHGHTTESCNSLKHFLERLLRQGHINQYLPRQMLRTPAHVGGNEAADKGKNIVNVVIGGTEPSRKRAYHEVYTVEHRSSEPGEITFTSADLEGVEPGHTEALVIDVEILDNVVKKVLVDNGSSADIMFAHCWERMKLKGYQIKSPPGGSPLYGLGHNVIPTLGTVEIPTLFGTYPKVETKVIKFHVVNSPSAYNIILGRPTLALLRAIPSTTHLKMKFPTPHGVGECKGSTNAARSCYGSAMAIAETEPENIRRRKKQEKQRKKHKHSQNLHSQAEPAHEVQMVGSIDQGDGEETPQRVNPLLKECISRANTQSISPAAATETIELIPGNKERVINIGAGLDTVLKDGLTRLLREYADVFAWDPRDMPGLRESIALHKLNVRPTAKPKIQKRRNFPPERQRAIDEEIDKMLEADLICEVSYPEWVANVVLVKKANGKWRATIKSRWHPKIGRRHPSLPTGGYIATKSCLLA